MKFLLFGTGDYYNRFKHWFDNEDVLALIDNSQDKQGTILDGVRILSPADAVKLEYDFVVVLSFYITQMRQQLMELGVPKEKILHFYELRKVLSLKEQVDFKVPAEAAGQKILLLSHDLNLGGPSLALLHLAKVLKHKRKYVLFGSMIDGPLRPQVEAEGIPVVVDNNLQIGSMDEIVWTHQFDVIVANTINYYNFLAKRNLDVPFIWWLHDAIFFYEGVDKDVLKNISLENMKVASVGPVPKAAITTYRKDVSVSNLFYQVEDTALGQQNVLRDDNKFRFLTIGYVESRKGQDILIDAIEKLPKEIFDKCEFYIVGQDSSLFAEEIKRRVKSYPNIKVTGVMDRTEIDKQYQLADVFVCSSREDPMPTVVTEAMMHSLPVIASDAIGTAWLLKDKEDSMLFKSEDADELAGILEWVVSNPTDIQKIGMQGRKVYEKYFSRNAFEKSIRDLFE